MWLHLNFYLFWRCCESQLIQGIPETIKTFFKRNIITSHLFWFFFSILRENRTSESPHNEPEKKDIDVWLMLFLYFHFLPMNFSMLSSIFLLLILYSLCQILFTVNHIHGLCRIWIYLSTIYSATPMYSALIRIFMKAKVI